MRIRKSKTEIPIDRTLKVVGIGASAGGLDAFRKFLQAIPENSGLAYVLVQHLDPNHESLLAALLSKVTKLPVVEITANIEVQPGHIYILPSNKMLVATGKVLKLIRRPPKSEKQPHLPIDIFLNSLAKVYKTNAIGVVLSGSASDGTIGLAAIKENGGITFVQDPQTAAYKGMPESAIAAGVTDHILPPDSIPGKIHALTQRTVTGEAPGNEEVFREILILLKLRKGVDFTYYKQTTIRRRIHRRMVLSNYKYPGDYLDHLKENNQEQDNLYQDLLIPVTGFFRDPQVFEYICRAVFPVIAKNKELSNPARIWVAGCSTGEEAYSFAICFKEFFGECKGLVQIFATDISERAIHKARAGIYSKKQLEGISSGRIGEFFTKVPAGYQVNKQIRELCVFSGHNLLNDPPFSKMDLISCRNVLIYMEPYLQRKALTVFHYALNPMGYLLLGKSETSSSVPNLFAALVKNERLFRKKDVPGKIIQLAPHRSNEVMQNKNPDPNDKRKFTDFQKIADEIMLSRYSPAGVVVNDALDILHFRGATGAYLEQTPGKPSHNLIKMARQGLGFELRNLMHKVRKDKVQTLKENVAVQVNGLQHIINIEVIPLPNMVEPHYLVLFHESLQHPVVKSSRKTKKEDNNLLVQQLEKDLEQARTDMASITEQQEATNEELQSANEELLSSSEELQSLNEELETSKEELQSTVEELTVVNNEMLSLNEQLRAERDYSQAIIGTIRESLLMLDSNLRVKSANRSFYEHFKVKESETEGKLIYELGNRQWDNPELRKVLSKILTGKKAFSDFLITFNFPSIGERTMLLNGREIAGDHLILLSIEDITEHRKAELILQKSEEQFRMMADLMPQKIWTADAEGRVNYVNENWLNFTGLASSDLTGWGWKEVVHPDDWKENKRKWYHSIKTGDRFEFEHRFLNDKGQYLWHLSRAVAIDNVTTGLRTWLVSSTEVQLQKEQNEELEKTVKHRTEELQGVNEELLEKNISLSRMNKEQESFNYVSSHDLQEPLRKIQTFISLLSGKETGNLSETGRDYFQRITNAASRMQTLISDLLSYSRAKTVGEKVKKTELVNIVENVIVQMKELIDEQHVDINLGALCSADIIPFQFEQLFSNLISNSIKFRKPERLLKIEIRSEVVEGRKLNNELLLKYKEYCHVTYEDNGIGFEPTFNTKVFELFQRLHGKDEFPGTGIGLSIVKKIVENHEGVITASGVLNEGVKFDIYIPVLHFKRNTKQV